VGFVLFRARRQLNTTRLSVTIHFTKVHKEIYLKYGFMKYTYCTKITKFDFFTIITTKDNQQCPLKQFMKYSFGTFNPLALELDI